MIKLGSDIHPFQITLTTLAGVLAQSSLRHMIAAVDAFPAEWDRLEFTYQGQPAALVRIPRPEKADETVLEVSPDFHLSAYLIKCPHQGCVVRLHSGNPQKLVCRCKRDVFWAKDGRLVAGIRDEGLQRLTLKIVGTGSMQLALSQVWAKVNQVKISPRADNGLTGWVNA